MKLENWYLTSNYHHNPYLAPECIHTLIGGNIYDHQNHKNGKHVITSKIVKFEDGCVYTKSGSKYELGSVNEQYLEKFPDVMKTLKLI